MNRLMRAALGVGAIFVGDWRDINRAQEITAALNGYLVTHSDNCPIVKT
jgi:hypothetical protein